MDDGSLANTIWGVAALQDAHDSPATEGFGSGDHEAGEVVDVFQLQGELAKRVAVEGIEAGGNEDEVGDEVRRGQRRTTCSKVLDVLLGGEAAGHGDVPDVPGVSVRADVFRGSGTGIPGPLVHRHKMDIWIALNERLCTVAVMYVPIHDQDALAAVRLAGVVGAYRYIPKETEAHRAVVQGVVPWWADGAEASGVLAVEGEINGVEDAAGGGAGGVPGAFAGDGIGVETAATGDGGGVHGFDVARVVREGELFGGGVAPFEVLDGMEEVGLIPEGACDST